MSLIDTTERPVMSVEDEINAAYNLLEEERSIEIELAYAVRAVNEAAEEDLVSFLSFMETLGIPLPFELEEVRHLQPARPLRRPSHEARNMTREGSRSPRVRKNHSTKLRYAEIKAENAARQSWKQNSVRSRRKFAKLAASCKNSGTVARARLELIGTTKSAA